MHTESTTRLPNTETTSSYREWTATAVAKLPALDFFAGSGLATEGLRPFFSIVWANDFCNKKKDVYCTNHRDVEFYPGPIESVNGSNLPSSILSWASFPCQDLSLAGNLKGIDSARSGLVWHWLRVMDEMSVRPPIVVAENVVGLVSAGKGIHYRLLHEALVRREYRVGAIVIDATYWLPHSRPRVFVVGVDKRISVTDLETNRPDWLHPASVMKASEVVKDWIWWRLPKPRINQKKLEKIVEINSAVDDDKRGLHNLSLIPFRHRERLEKEIAAGRRVFPGYKRTRGGRQVLELRFDGIAGCLRTPQGGSSRQLLVLWREGRLETRLLTVPEAASLMGVRKNYKLPGSYNDGYKALGDAVAVPAVRHLARHLLAPLARRVLV